MERNTFKNSQKKRMRDFFSGLVAGIISVTVCNPLDVTRTRLNLMSSSNHLSQYNGFTHALKSIYRQEGVKGYFAGYKVNVKAIPIFHSIFFPIYEAIKDSCQKRNFSKTEQYLTSSILAGSFCNIVTNPIWVVRTRVMAQALHSKSQQYHSEKIIQILKSMVHTQGFGSLFKGVSASMLGVSNAVIFFYIYENFREKLVEQNNKKFSSCYVLAASITSKFTASTVTYPFLVARTIMQDHRNCHNTQSPSFTKVFRDVYSKRGIKGFYAGLKPDLLRLLPSNSIVFLVYEFMKTHIDIAIE